MTAGSHICTGAPLNLWLGLAARTAELQTGLAEHMRNAKSGLYEHIALSRTDILNEVQNTLPQHMLIVHVQASNLRLQIDCMRKEIDQVDNYRTPPTLSRKQSEAERENEILMDSWTHSHRSRSDHNAVTWFYSASGIAKFMHIDRHFN